MFYWIIRNNKYLCSENWLQYINFHNHFQLKRTFGCKFTSRLLSTGLIYQDRRQLWLCRPELYTHTYTHTHNTYTHRHPYYNILCQSIVFYTIIAVFVNMCVCVYILYPSLSYCNSMKPMFSFWEYWIDLRAISKASDLYIIRKSTKNIINPF